MRTLTLLLALSLAACGGKSNPAPAPEDDAPSEETGDEPTGDTEMMTPEECEAQGGSVKGDIGDGNVQCDAGFIDIGNVSGGVEQQLCCQQAPDNAE